MDWKNKPNQIFNKVKNQLFGKGVQTFYFLDQFITQFDPQNSRVLTSHFFNLFLNKVGVFLTTQQIRNIRDLYSKSKEEDLILYRDFLEDVKYSISESIANLIGQAFDCLDLKHQGFVSIQTLETYYNSKEHPHCQTRRKAPEDIKAQFMSAVHRKADKNGRISKEAFVDYYAELNFCIPNERESYFKQIIVGTWGLKNSDDYVSQKRLKEIEFTLFEKIRLKSDGKTNQWKTGKKALAYFDLGDKKVASYEEFKRGLDKFGCNFKDHESQALFGKYAEGNVLDYEVFTKAIMDLDINGMVSQPNLLQTRMGTHHFKVTH